MSNELKAIVVMADLREEADSITRDRCISVEHFDYCCSRNRDEKGYTYHASIPAMLNFSVRVNAADQVKQFYKKITSNTPGAISFLFNASFSDAKHLTDYADAMVAEGFVIDVQEDFRSAALFGQDDQQIIARVRMQVHSITYMLSNAGTKTLAFVQ